MVGITIAKKVWNIIVWIILIIEAILVILFNALTIFNIEPYVVTSGSMEPKYKVGFLIYVKEVDPMSLKVTDAITFYMKDSNIVATHEIYEIDIQNKMFRTQGINNKNEKGEIIKDATPVEFENLIGKPIFSIPYLGYINNFITQKPGLYIIILGTISIVVVSFILDNNKRVSSGGKNEK